MSGTTMSTPSSSLSGNMRPASITMMSSPQRTAMQFMPNSPSPPRGTTWSLPAGIWKVSERVSEQKMLTRRQSGCGLGHRVPDDGRRPLGTEFAFPARDHDGRKAVADHVDGGAPHIHELVDAHQQEDRL